MDSADKTPDSSHHVVTNPNGGWDVKVSGGDRAIKHRHLKQDAVRIARELGREQRTELVIHKKGDQIGRKDKYRHADPKKAPG